MFDLLQVPLQEGYGGCTSSSAECIHPAVVCKASYLYTAVYAVASFSGDQHVYGLTGVSTVNLV